MFLIDTITVIPSRIARKLVSNWLLRSKISRKTSVRNRMAFGLLVMAATARAATRLRRFDLGLDLVLGHRPCKAGDRSTGGVTRRVTAVAVCGST